MIISIDAEKTIWQNPAPIYGKKKKNSQQSGNRGIIPEHQKPYMTKPQPTSYTMEENKKWFP